MSTSTPSTPVSLQAAERDADKNPRQLRQAGIVPATLYGNKQEPINIQVDTKEFTTLYSKGARIFQLEGIGAVARAHQLQINPISQEVITIEFLRLTSEEVAQASKAQAETTQACELPAAEAVSKTVETQEKETAAV